MIPVVIPTHGRAGRVLTLDAIDDAILCVAESQLPLYRDAYPTLKKARLLVHPDEVLGLSPKREWIFEQVGDVLMVDDDCGELRRLYDPEARSTAVPPDEALEIVQNAGEMARAMGVYLWGMASNAIGRNFAAAHPFRTTGYVGGLCLGLFKEGPLGVSKLRFPPESDCMVEDYYVSALNAFYYRRIWADDRFGFAQRATFHNLGGQSNWRTSGAEERWFRELKRLFGENVIVEKHMASTHEFEKILAIPWARGI